MIKEKKKKEAERERENKHRSKSFNSKNKNKKINKNNNECLTENMHVFEHNRKLILLGLNCFKIFYKGEKKLGSRGQNILGSTTKKKGG